MLEKWKNTQHAPSDTSPAVLYNWLERLFPVSVVPLWWIGHGASVSVHSVTAKFKTFILYSPQLTEQMLSESLSHFRKPRKNSVAAFATFLTLHEMSVGLGWAQRSRQADRWKHCSLIIPDSIHSMLEIFFLCINSKKSKSNLSSRVCYIIAW